MLPELVTEPFHPRSRCGESLPAGCSRISLPAARPTVPLGAEIVPVLVTELPTRIASPLFDVMTPWLMMRRSRFRLRKRAAAHEGVVGDVARRGDEAAVGDDLSAGSDDDALRIDQIDGACGFQ